MVCLSRGSGPYEWEQREKRAGTGRILRKDSQPGNRPGLEGPVEDIDVVVVYI